VKTAFLAGVAALSVLSASAAHAQGTPVLLPPVEYDHPYSGDLLIIDDVKWQTLRDNCGPIYRDAPGAAFLSGCAHVYPGKCVILIAEQRTISTMAGAHPSWSYDNILRHEIGHCNGWPGNHAGGRSLWDDPYARKPENAPTKGQAAWGDFPVLDPWQNGTYEDQWRWCRQHHYTPPKCKEM